MLPRINHRVLSSYLLAFTLMNDRHDADVTLINTRRERESTHRQKCLSKPSDTLESCMSFTLVASFRKNKIQIPSIIDQLIAPMPVRMLTNSPVQRDNVGIFQIKCTLLGFLRKSGHYSNDTTDWL